MAVPIYIDWKIGRGANFRDGYWGVGEMKSFISDNSEMPIRYPSAEGK